MKSGLPVLDLARGSPEVAILGANQKESGLWGGEWATCVSVRHAHCNRKCNFSHFKQNLRGSCSHRLLVKVDEDSGSAPNWKIEDKYCSSPFTNICYFLISGCFAEDRNVHLIKHFCSLNLSLCDVFAIVAVAVFRPNHFVLVNVLIHRPFLDPVWILWQIFSVNTDKIWYLFHISTLEVLSNVCVFDQNDGRFNFRPYLSSVDDMRKTRQRKWMDRNALVKVHLTPKMFFAKIIRLTFLE